jgi:hypothetical protein
MLTRGLGVRGAFALIGVTSALACAPRLAPGADGTIDVSDGRAAVELTYLGSGGWIITLGGEQLLAAPLFTNPSFLRTGLLSIEPDTVAIDGYMDEHDVSNARVILIGHGHYDHAMDVPRVASHHATGARILTNRTAANLFGTWSGLAERIDVANGHEGTEERVGRWFSYGPRIRVMPLQSKHAPHFDGLTLFEGTADVLREEPPRRAVEWLDGETVAFLIDFLDGEGEVRYRIYYQDAVAPAPWGFAPAPLIEEYPVDLAILVPATFDQVDWHPEAFIENLRPERVLLGHWEDFFVPMDTPTQSVRLLDLGHFEHRLERVFDGEWWRPEIGTVFRFPAGG